MVTRSSIVILALALVTACGAEGSRAAPDADASQRLLPPTVDAEATDIPFTECDQDNGKPVPRGEERVRLEAVLDQLHDDGLFDQGVVSAGGANSVYGIISIELSRRSQPSLDWLAARVDPDDMCIKLPPVGYYNRPYEEATWVLNPEAPQPNADTESISLLIDSASRDCGYDPEGRILEPVVVYGSDSIDIRIPLDHVRWGPHDCIGWGPAALVLELDEPIGDRNLVRPPS